MNYIGNVWHKCDLHLHTTRSSCFRDQTVTNQQWIERAKEQELDCIAVTDHNDYRNIDELMELGRQKGIVVFPGVEITCESAKMHLLVIFDTTKGGSTVRDFLCKVDIDGQKVGECIGTSYSIFDVCKKAKEMGAIVIASHIDDFNAINKMSMQHLEKLMDGNCLDGVEVTNLDIWESCKEDEMAKAICDTHGTRIFDAEVECWRKTFRMAKRKELPIVCFSDNPSGQYETTHGLWGMGCQYTWMKMKKNPNLKSLRHALYGSDARIKTYVESPYIPEEEPDFWIKSLSIEKSVLNEHAPITVEFNPHFNCIIGESGSGKSSILRLIAGVLGNWNTYFLEEVQETQRDFYKRYSKEQEQGVFLEDTVMVLEVCWKHSLYKIEVSDVKSMEEQNIGVYRYEEGTWNVVEKKEFLQAFRIQMLMQKELYEITKHTQVLIPFLDSMSDKMEELLLDKNEITKKFMLINQKKRNGIDLTHQEKREIYTDYHNCIGLINKERKKVLKEKLGDERRVRVSIKSNYCFDSDAERIDVSEDEISVCYKMDTCNKHKPLAGLTLGQKVTAVMKLMLVDNEIPLLLDQPEDELDHRLVYENVVERLRQQKQHRQIIAVSNDSNIVVNGEPEYIISLGISKNRVKVSCAGSMDQEEMRKEICNILEGTEKAFWQRVKKYDSVCI